MLIIIILLFSSIPVSAGNCILHVVTLFQKNWFTSKCPQCQIEETPVSTQQRNFLVSNFNLNENNEKFPHDCSSNMLYYGHTYMEKSFQYLHKMNKKCGPKSGPWITEYKWSDSFSWTVRLICHVRLESYEFYNSNFESSLVAKVILYVFWGMTLV